MRIGILRRTASYQEPTDVSDDLGQEVPGDWPEVFALRCEVRTPYGREAIQADALAAVVSHIVTHRYPGRLPKPRGRYVLDDGQILHVVSAGDPDGRRRTVVSMCDSKPYPDGDA